MLFFKNEILIKRISGSLLAVASIGLLMLNIVLYNKSVGLAVDLYDAKIEISIIMSLMSTIASGVIFTTCISIMTGFIGFTLINSTYHKVEGDSINEINH